MSEYEKKMLVDNKKQLLIQTARTALVSKQEIYKQSLIDTRVKVDESYILQSTEIAARTTLLENMIEELITLELEHTHYTKDLTNKLVYDDKIYKENQAKLAILEKKSTGTLYQNTTQQYQNTMNHQDGDIWFPANI
tara:strand:- start:1437 stop:1847 length:411 start_codon:yes stop_codon:yes gene_type:complete